MSTAQINVGRDLGIVGQLVLASAAGSIRQLWSKLWWPVVVPGLVAAGFSQSAQGGVDEAIALSRQTGQPILAVADYRTSPTLQPLLQQLSRFPGFVRLAVEPNTGEWTKLMTKAQPVDKVGLPFLMILRADGHVIYQGDVPNALAQVLQKALAESGTVFSPAEVKQVETLVAKAQQALRDGNRSAAVAALKRYLGVVTYAVPVKPAIQMAEQLQADGDQALQQAEEKAFGAEPMQGLVELCEVQRVYAGFPELRKKIGKAVSQARRDSDLRALYQQAEKLDKAAFFAERGDSAKAATAYKQIAQAEPNSPAGKLALQRLALLADKGVDVGTDLKLPEIDRSKIPAKPSFVGYTLAASLVRMAHAYKERNPARARAFAQKALTAQPPDAVAQAAAQQLMKELGGQ